MAKFSWLSLAQTLFATSIPLLQESVETRKAPSRSAWLNFGLQTLLGYIATSGNARAVSDAGTQVATTIENINVVSPPFAATPTPQRRPVTGGSFLQG